VSAIKQTYRALVIEDQDLMRVALIRELKASLSECVVLGAASFEQALTVLQAEDFDLVIIDPGMPGYNPTLSENRIAVVERIIELCPEAIHLVVTGLDTEEEGEACRRLGAAAYLGKTGLDREAFAGILQDISETGFSMYLSQIREKTHEFMYSALTPREQEIIDWMRARPDGMRRRDIYDIMSRHFDIDAGTAEKYYKQARAKLLKAGILPKEV
jgi:DNA-binding NarL/FixJ family response regulator